MGDSWWHLGDLGWPWMTKGDPLGCLGCPLCYTEWLLGDQGWHLCDPWWPMVTPGWPKVTLGWQRVTSGWPSVTLGDPGCYRLTQGDPWVTKLFKGSPGQLLSTLYFFLWYYLIKVPESSPRSVFRLQSSVTLAWQLRFPVNHLSMSASSVTFSMGNHEGNLTMTIFWHLCQIMTTNYVFCCAWRSPAQGPILIVCLKYQIMLPNQWRPKLLPQLPKEGYPKLFTPSGVN